MRADLCGRCAVMKAATHEVRKVAGGVDHKVTCAECGRRRYGGTYEVVLKGRKTGKPIFDELDRAEATQREEAR